MSRICAVCGKKPGTGMNVSHSHRRSKRRWYPNLQPVRISVAGGRRRTRVCASCIKAGKVQKTL